MRTDTSELTDDMSPVQRVNAFELKHGKDNRVVDDNNWILFADGAVREGNPMGALVAPSEDPFERAQSIVRYRTIWAQQAMNQFDELRSHLRALGLDAKRFGHPAPQLDQLNELRTLKALAETRHAALVRARKMVVDREPDLIKNARAAKESARVAAEDFLSVLGRIEI